MLEVDLDALRANWCALRDRTAASVICAGVVKAEAYGLGLERVVRVLAAAGCTTFFTATLEEGRQIRAIAAAADIYILDGLLPGAAAHYTDSGLRPALSSCPEIAEWADHCDATGRMHPAAVHVDTGMNRLGLSLTELRARQTELAAMIGRFDLALVMSHLACADTPDHPLNRSQKTLFDEARTLLPPAPASLANSGGIFLGPDYHYDLVRPGIAVYGGRARDGLPNPMQPVVRLSGRILQIRELQADESIGYGATHVFKAPARTATISYGYADGYLRAISTHPAPPPTVTIATRQAPLVGRISMDLVTADVSAIPPGEIERGGWAELIGNTVGIDDLADSAGTIGYEILTSLGRRVHRIYLENGKAV